MFTFNLSEFLSYSMIVDVDYVEKEEFIKKSKNHHAICEYHEIFS